MKVLNFSELENQVIILDEEEKLRLAANIMFLTILYLKKQENITPFKFVEKLFRHLNEENQKKLFEDISFILDKYYYQISNKSIDNSEITGFILERLRKSGIITEPEQEGSEIVAVINENRAKYPPEISNDFMEGIKFNEGLKYIIPVFTQKAIQAITNKPESKENISFLKFFDNESPLLEIYEKSFSNMKIIDFIEKVIDFYKNGFFLFHKSRYTPKNKELKTRMGELLISLGLITRDNLEKLLSIQSGESKMIDIENNNLVIVTTLPGEKFYLKTDRKLLGELMVEYSLISQRDLDRTINLLQWYNTVFQVSKTFAGINN